MEKNSFNGKQLTKARKRLGVTMPEIAELIEVKRQYINKIEKNLENKFLSEKSINIIAEKLNVLPGYFYIKNNKNNVNNENMMHFRSSHLTLRLKGKAYTFSEDVLDTYKYVKEYLEELKLKFPTFHLGDKIEIDSINQKEECFDEIEKITSDIRKILALGDGPIDNMVRVLESNGILVTSNSELSTKVDAYCYVESDQKSSFLPIVIRNESKSPVRCRFDLAHEFGHIILHPGEISDANENPHLEKQANYFSSSFLLPKDSMLKEFPRFTSSHIPWEELMSLKTRWKVSIAALVKRAFDIGMINEITYKRVFINISKKGWRTCEPGDHKSHTNYIELEKPELMRNAINLIIKSDKSFLPNIMNELQLKPELLKLIFGLPNLEDEQFTDTHSPVKLVINNK